MKRFVHVQELQLANAKRFHRCVDSAGRVLVSVGGVGYSGTKYHATLHHSKTWLCSDFIPMPSGGASEGAHVNRPAGGDIKDAVLCITGKDWVNVRHFRNFYNWLSRAADPASAWAWENGWANFDPGGCTDDTFLLNPGGSYPLPGYSSGYYLDDSYGGFSHPTNPTHPPELTVGNVAAPDWQTWTATKPGALVAYDEFGNRVYNGWRVHPGNPDGVNWNYGYEEGQGIVQHFPLQWGGHDLVVGFPNHVGADWTLSAPGNYSVNYGSTITAALDEISFDNVFRMIDDGSTILRADGLIKCMGLARWKLTGSRTFHPERWGIEGLDPWDHSFTEVVDNSEVSFAIFGRQTVTGDRGMRHYVWEPIANSIPSVASADKWQLVDFKELLQAYVDDLRRSKYDKLAIIPSVYKGVVGSLDLRQMLVGVRPTMTFEKWKNPGSSVTSFFPTNCPDAYWDTDISAEFVTWTSIAFSSLDLEWKLPDRALKRKIVPFNMVRTD